MNIILKNSTNMANLFSLKNLRNKPHRDGFDLSFTNTMTAPLGALVPCMFKDVMPGDKFKINASWFTRSQPCTAPAYSKFTEYIDFFFVPYHFLWRYFPDFYDQAGNNNFAENINTSGSPVFTQHPYFTKNGFESFLNSLRKEYSYQSSDIYPNSAYNLFGPSGNVFRLYDIKRLFEFFGYGEIDIVNNTSSEELYKLDFTLSTHTPVMNPFPLLAYNKIYNDFFRNSQWEKPITRNFNVDYLSPYGSTMEMGLANMDFKDRSNHYLDTIFDLKYCNYNKDLFTGVLPNKQFGSEALASPLVYQNGSPLQTFDIFGGGDARFTTVGINRSADNKPIDTVKINNFSNNVGISALAIRQAEFLQKWKEITQSGGTDYVSQIEKHFGVKPNSDISHRCQYLGGVTKNFGADEVVNTNLIANYEPTVMGKMVNVGNGNIDFSSNEHGIIMGIYHISLLPSYDCFGDDLLRKTMPTDYVIPELDNIGMQPVYQRQIVNSLQDTLSNVILGYVPRYSEYKTSVDVINGAFRKIYRNWVTPINNSLVSPSPKPDYTLFKVSPRTLDNLFNVQYDGTYATDPFFVNLSFDIKAVRNISRDGLPW